MTQNRTIYGRIAILTAAAVLILAGTAAASIQDDIQKSFKVGPGGTLTIDTQRGSIEIEAGRGETVEVEVLREVRTSSEKTAKDILERFKIEFDQSGSNVEITAAYDGSDWRRFWDKVRNKLRVKFIVSVPERYNVNLKTRGGSISVAGLEGDVQTRTSGGSLRFEAITGPIQGNTSGGSIHIGEVNGRVNVHTSGGSIRIQRARGEVEAHTSGGGITVEEVMGAINARTSGGSIKAYISEKPTHGCKLKTSGGSVTVRLAPDIGMDVDAHTSGGSVHTEFPVTLRGTIKRNTLQAKLNGGGPELYLRTSGGSIYIKKK